MSKLVRFMAVIMHLLKTASPDEARQRYGPRTEQQGGRRFRARFGLVLAPARLSNAKPSVSSRRLVVSIMMELARTSWKMSLAVGELELERSKKKTPAVEKAVPFATASSRASVAESTGLTTEKRWPSNVKDCRAIEPAGKWKSHPRGRPPPARQRSKAQQAGFPHHWAIPTR